MYGLQNFVTSTNGATGCTRVYLMKSTDKVVHAFRIFHKMVETKFDKKIKALRSNNGGEYISKKFQSYLSDNGINL